MDSGYAELPPAIIRIAAITGNEFRKLEEGMPKEDVIKLLGKPDGLQKVGNVERLTYANRLMSGWGWDRSDYYVDLTDGRVSGYGNGEVRDRRPNTLMIIPTRPISQ